MHFVKYFKNSGCSLNQQGVSDQVTLKGKMEYSLQSPLDEVCLLFEHVIYFCSFDWHVLFHADLESSVHFFTLLPKSLQKLSLVFWLKWWLLLIQNKSKTLKVVQNSFSLGIFKYFKNCWVNERFHIRVFTDEFLVYCTFLLVH